MLVTSVIGSVDFVVFFESVTSGVSVALTLVGDSVTRLVNECDMCVLMVKGEGVVAEVVGVVAEVVLVVNCGVGAGAGKEKRHEMRKLTSITQHTWPQLFEGLMHRHHPLKKTTIPWTTICSNYLSTEHKPSNLI